MRRAKGTYGGRRPGAGRKRKADPLIAYSVDITREHAERLKAWGGGDLSADRTLNLVGDLAAPGNNKVYGTDSGGTRVWKDDPVLVGSSSTFVQIFTADGTWTKPSGTKWAYVLLIGAGAGAAISLT